MDEEVIFLRELVQSGTKFLMVGMAAANPGAMASIVLT
jgi:hypothetical protein